MSQTNYSSNRCVVWTGDGRVFFFNPSTRCSVWEKPEELRNRTDVDKLIANTPDSPQQSTGCLEFYYKQNHSLSFSIVDRKDDVKEVKSDKKKKSDSGTDEPPPKKSKSNEEGSALFAFEIIFFSKPYLTFSVIEDVKIEEPTKDTAMEAEVKAAQQRAVIPLEERVQQFKAMLAEKEVILVKNEIRTPL